jgi:predicted DNA-binding transcriptional regulator AlpA
MPNGKKQKSNSRLTMTIPEFAAAIGCSRNLAYSLARQDKLPVHVIRLGAKRLVVSRRAVEQLLNGEVDSNAKQ